MSQMLRRVSYWNLVVALPILGSMIVLREPLLALFGRGYEAGAAPLVLLALGQLVLNAAGPLTAVINLSGHPRVTLFDNVLVFSANLVLCIILVPRYGMSGAAASTLIALCSVTLLQVGQVARLFRIHPFRDDQLRCARGRRHRCAGHGDDHAAAMARAALRGRRGRPGLHRGLHRGNRRAGRARGDERTRATCARSYLAQGIDLVERMGGIASPPTLRVDKKRRSAVDGCGRD